MKISRKLLVGGLASITAVAGLASVSFSAPTSAMTVADLKEPQKLLQLNIKQTTSAELKTELDCTTHTLKAKVTNKTDKPITPNVWFNEEPINMPYPVTIEPGKTHSYAYNFSGNNKVIDVEVRGDTIGTITASPEANCLEPVTFEATSWSSSAVVGQLRNNSNIVQQTAYTQVGNGDVRVEMLEPGETRTVAMPFKAFANQKTALVKIATPAGYESSYTVDLEKATIPVPPLPVGVNR